MHNCPHSEARVSLLLYNQNLQSNCYCHENRKHQHCSHAVNAENFVLKPKDTVGQTEYFSVIAVLKQKKQMIHTEVAPSHLRKAAMLTVSPLIGAIVCLT